MVGDDNLEVHFRQARYVALANSLYLQLIHEAPDRSFFIPRGLVGIFSNS
jgi:hypothetical protein